MISEGDDPSFVYTKSIISCRRPQSMFGQQIVVLDMAQTLE